MGGAVGLILHSCDSTESLTQGGSSFNNLAPPPPLLPRFAEIAAGRVRFDYSEGWEVLGPGSPAEALERRQRKQVGELQTICLTGGVSHSALLWNAGLWKERRRHVEQETVSAPGRLI